MDKLEKLQKLAAQMWVFSRPHLETFWFYAKVELVPPGPGDIPDITRGFSDIIRRATSGTWKDLTVKEAWLNALVTTEIVCWFYVGECIGKRHIVGYDV